MADLPPAQHSNGHLQPIPRVPKQYFGLLGNVPDIDPAFFVKSLWHLTDLYGPIYQLDLLGRKLVVVSSYELMEEVKDDENFEKIVTGPLFMLRDMVGDGLFTAHSSEKNWHKAHHILMPVFGPIAVRKMFDKQMDIASQLVLRWDRMGPENEIMTSDDFTRLAFDTIGLCAFNYRFNEFYTDNVHPFATQMADSLVEAGKRANRTSLETHARIFSQHKYWHDIQSMHKLCDDVVRARVQNAQPDVDDLLNVMLNVADPDTGERLDQENIRYQMATFLIAGHETTSGTLAFLFHNLLQNPELYHKAQKEVDEVLGNDPLTLKHLPKLKYIDACIKETLRFQGPINVIQRHAKKPYMLAGKYALTPDITVLCNLRGIHHDPAVWGEDASECKPERMLDFGKIPRGAWNPFGVGMRSCIGRAFAEQEMVINVALILQSFQVEMVDPSYTLSLKSTLSVKPDNFKIRVRRRAGRSPLAGLRASGTAEHAIEKQSQDRQAVDGQELRILYGSNAGTCKSYAEELAAGAPGFRTTIQTLDAATEHLPTDHPVIIIAPSYEGKPADNAKKFVSWLEANRGSSDMLADVRYALFGVGNSEWASTFHKVPKLVDEYLGNLGASRIAESGFVDVKTDAVGPWEDWMEMVKTKLGRPNTKDISAEQEIKATITRSDAVTALGGSSMSSGTVKENMPLCDDAVGLQKRHTEIELPENASYRTGDYLVVLPFNHRDIVGQVLRRFGVHADDMITIHSTNKPFLKTANPTSIFDLLTALVELNTPVTQRQLEKLASYTSDSATKASLVDLASPTTFHTSILPKRHSILDILLSQPTVDLPFAVYLDMLKPLTTRQYSISSSPLSASSYTFSSPRVACSITYDVETGPALSDPSRPFRGVCSTYLSSLQPGARLNCFVRSTNASFHLPSSPETPIIMVCAGTGIAPMRGFIQERGAIASAKGKPLGPALLYFGCRDFENDYVYKDELEHWQELGAVSIRPCFSRRGPPPSPTEGKSSHWKYVPDRMWDERDELASLFKNGAKIFVCGSASKLARSAGETCKKIYMDKRGVGDEEAERWLDAVKEDRYVSDVFG